MRTVFYVWNCLKVLTLVLIMSMIPVVIVYWLNIQDPTLGFLIGAPFGILGVMIGLALWPCWDFE